MITMLPVSARIYAGLLSLYPAELRRDFGAEIAQVFVEDLENSYRDRGVVGAAGVWWRSAKELWRIALPVLVSKREFAVPFIVFVLNEIYIGAILLSAGEGSFRAARPPSVGQVIIAAAMVTGLLPSLTAFVAIRVGNRGVPVPLVLGPK